jgi:hypothetical protein
MTLEKKTEGRKFDAGKAEYGLIPPHALHAMVEVLTIGAQKYARDNWKYVEDRERRYFDAMQRHIWAWKRGEINDPEDNLHHLAHAMCCLMFLHESSLYYKEGEAHGKNEGVAESSKGSKCTGSSVRPTWTAGQEASQYVYGNTKNNITIRNGSSGAKSSNSFSAPSSGSSAESSSRSCCYRTPNYYGYELKFHTNGEEYRDYLTLNQS